MIALSGNRSRTAGLAAAAGVFSLVLGSAVLVAPGAQAADPPGNNGTIKIEGVDIGSGPPDNNPHQGCTFTVEFYNYDEDPEDFAKVTFEDQPPTADGGLQVVSGDLTPFIGEDPASGGNDLDAKVTYTLKFTGDPHPVQGYHVKITVEADGSQGADKKHKVFWVEGCTTTTPPTTPPTKPPTTKPTKPPTTKPTKPPTTKPTKPTKPPVTHPTTAPETSAETTSAPATGIPTEVDAGLGSDSAATPGSSGWVNTVGGILLTSGGLLLALGAGLVLRRRGKHSL